MQRQGYRARNIVVLIALGAALALVARGLIRRAHEPMHLDYTVDLENAGEGRLAVTLRLTGTLPPTVVLGLPAGLFHDPGAGVTVTTPRAWRLDAGGGRGTQLPVQPRGRAWGVGGGRRPTEVAYAVELRRADAAPGADIRHHLSTAGAGWVRVAGFHLFLAPQGAHVGRVTVRFQAGAGGRLAAPWPAAGSPEGIVHRPAGREELANALIAWGDWRLHERAAGGCVVRVGVRGTWDFSDDEIVRLLLRLAEAEIAFFGEAPRPSVLLLVDANPLPQGAGFEYYGLHVGQSVLLLLDPGATWTDLPDKAASVAAHELFHGWLGEAIRQEQLEMNWFVEGATSWYTARLLVETGIWTARRAEEVVGGRIDAHYLGSPLLGRMTVAEAGRGFLRDPETTRFAYAGGTLAARALDAWLAERGGGPHPLDDVLRLLYARRDRQRLTRDSLEAAIRETCGSDASGWLQRHVYGSETLPRPAALF